MNHVERLLENNPSAEELEQDISILDKDDTRKTRLTLGDINSLRLASEEHDSQQKEEAVFVQKMYAQPQVDDLAI